MAVSDLSPETLLHAVRNLDQSKVDDVPETILALWRSLSKTRPGIFHAPEAVILRWLLKIMSGASPAAEQARRFPMTWYLLGALFQRMPLFSLAKGLADRKFLQVLQQTLDSISQPSAPDAAAQGRSKKGDYSGNDKNIGGSKKRKRNDATPFDLETARLSQGCLRSAEAVFSALYTLLTRLREHQSGVASNDGMGAEHIKSLLRLPAKESSELLKPMLQLCDLAITGHAAESSAAQETWISVIRNIWNLHLYGAADALEATMNLYTTICISLAKLTRSKDLSLASTVSKAWTRELQILLINTIVLPARAAFFNSEDVGILAAATGVTNMIPTLSSPILFEAIASASASGEDATGRHDQRDWIQKAFEVVEEPLRDVEGPRKKEAISRLLDTAIRHEVDLPLETLRRTCRDYALQPEATSFALISRVASLGIDAFLASENGLALLDDVLLRLKGARMQSLDESEALGIGEFMEHMCQGYAKSRDLEGFVKKWYDGLASCEGVAVASEVVLSPWASFSPRKSFSDHVQSSASIRQLEAILDWLATQDVLQAQKALLVTLEAILEGITDEEYIDAIGIRPITIIRQIQLGALDDQALASYWRIFARVISWSTVAEVSKIRDKIGPELHNHLKTGRLNSKSTLGAFGCWASLALVDLPNSDDSWCFDVQFFLERLSTAARDSDLHLGEYLETPRLATIFPCGSTLADKLADLTAHAVQQRINSEGIGGAVAFRDKSGYWLEAGNLDNKTVTAAVTKALASFCNIQPGTNWRGLREAALLILDLPNEVISKFRQQDILKSSIQLLENSQDLLASEGGNQTYEIVLSLCIYLAQTAPSPKIVNFSNLSRIGESLSRAATTWHGEKALLQQYKAWTLFGRLVANVIQNYGIDETDHQQGSIVSASSTIQALQTGSKEENMHAFVLMSQLLSRYRTMKADQSGGIEADKVRRVLSAWLSKYVATFVSSNSQLSDVEGSPHLFVLFDQLWLLDPDDFRTQCGPLRSQMQALCHQLIAETLRAGWQLKTALALAFGQDQAARSFDLLDDGGLFGPIEKPDVDAAGSASDLLPLRANVKDVMRYVDTVIGSMSNEDRGLSLVSLMQGLRTQQHSSSTLLAIARLSMLGDQGSSARDGLDKLELSHVQSALADQLPRATSAQECALIVQIMVILLEKQHSHMTQYNVDNTLSLVASMCSSEAALPSKTKQSAQFCDWMCKLVEVVLKRHRHRLEGHMHLPVNAMQCLLRLVITGGLVDSASPTGADQAQAQEANAKQFARLLTLICEPSVASVARGHHGPSGQLDSAKDVARRAAGQHMYLVLMMYLKLQLETNVPRPIRDALEPGFFSVLDISRDHRRAMNEAMDGSGRAVFKEFYRQYLKFGKWSGV